MRPADFEQKNVFITGGSMGIGLAVAKRLAALGSNILLIARREGPLQRARAEVATCQKSDGQRVEGRALDTADGDAVERALGEAVDDFGAPDVLINCVGRAIPGYFESISTAQLEETLRINVLSCWNTVHALVPHMKARGGGYIVNTASMAGLIGVFGYTDYCASKFAVVGFTEALRAELKPHNIDVSVLCPPDTDTPGFAEENKTKPEETRVISGGARLMTADDVADALICGMARRTPVIVPGVDSKLAAWAKRFVPGLVEAVVDRGVRKVAKRRGSS